MTAEYGKLISPVFSLSLCILSCQCVLLSAIYIRLVYIQAFNVGTGWLLFLAIALEANKAKRRLTLMSRSAPPLDPRAFSGLVDSLAFNPTMLHYAALSLCRRLSAFRCLF